MTPYVLYKCAMSLDGYLDDTSPHRLVLSNAEDLLQRDRMRAACDAIMVGAQTIRTDNPQLIVHSKALQKERVGRGLESQPLKVTVTTTGDIDTNSRFFKSSRLPLIYCPQQSLDVVQKRLGTVATIVVAGDTRINLHQLLEDLSERAVRRVLIEGGSRLGSEFLQAGLVDELQISMAPFFIGEANAPKFAKPNPYPHHPTQRMILKTVEQVGDMAVITWLLKRSDTIKADMSTADRNFLKRAIKISRHCPPSNRAFSVGAIIVNQAGHIIAEGYSRETGPAVHAEEVALTKARDLRINLQGATLYSSLEPCGQRLSGHTACVDRIIEAGLAKVVYALNEPPLFVKATGAHKLKAQGITVVAMPELAVMVKKINQHLFPAL